VIDDSYQYLEVVEAVIQEESKVVQRRSVRGIASKRPLKQLTCVIVPGGGGATGGVVIKGRGVIEYAHTRSFPRGVKSHGRGGGFRYQECSCATEAGVAGIEGVMSRRISL
jgi:hypothetical protein